MKNTILYLSITSLLTIPNAFATEVDSRPNELTAGVYGLVESLQTLQAQNESLRDQIETQAIKQAMDASLEKVKQEDLVQALVHMAGEANKEKALKDALQRLVGVLNEEQTEARDLLSQILEDLIPPSSLPIDESVLVSPPLESQWEGSQWEAFPLEETQILQAALLLSFQKTKAGETPTEIDIDEMETAKNRANPKETTPKETPTLKGKAAPEDANNLKDNKNSPRALLPVLSPYQQKLHSQRNLIGANAWTALDGTNPSLSARLVEAIQGYPGKSVEIYCLKSKNFTLLINRKVQDYPYVF